MSATWWNYFATNTQYMYRQVLRKLYRNQSNATSACLSIVYTLTMCWQFFLRLRLLNWFELASFSHKSNYRHTISAQTNSITYASSLQLLPTHLHIHTIRYILHAHVIPKLKWLHPIIPGCRWLRGISPQTFCLTGVTADGWISPLMF